MKETREGSARLSGDALNQNKDSYHSSSTGAAIHDDEIKASPLKRE
jgi:hypothetical protein